MVKDLFSDDFSLGSHQLKTGNSHIQLSLKDIAIFFLLLHVILFLLDSFPEYKSQPTINVKFMCQFRFKVLANTIKCIELDMWCLLIL